MSQDDPKYSLLDSIMFATERAAQTELEILTAIQHGLEQALPRSEVEKIDIAQNPKNGRRYLNVHALFDMHIAVKKQDTDKYTVTISGFDECVSDRKTACEQIASGFEHIQGNDALKQAGKKLADILTIDGESANVIATITEADLIILGAYTNVREKRGQAALNNFVSGLKK